MIPEYPDVTVQSLLLTLATSIWAVRKILIEDFGMSKFKANVAILIAIDAEKQLNANVQDLDYEEEKR